MLTAKDGDVVKIDYVLTVEGKVYDTSLADVAVEHEIHQPGREYAPLVFNVGSNEVIRGLNSGIVGMNVGERKDIVVSPVEGYGYYDGTRVQTLPRSMIERSGVDITPGTRLIIRTHKGSMVGIVSELGEDEVTLDFNPDLCDKTLQFQVFLREILG